jgi:hypothetical protein
MHSLYFQPIGHHVKKVAAEKKDPHSFHSYQSLAPKQNYLDITALIRSLQRAEGENDCFRTTNFNCQRSDCRWREYCFDKS